MGQPVPADDLPTNLVPAGDMPAAPKASPVTPTAEPSALRKGYDAVDFWTRNLSPWSIPVRGMEEMGKAVTSAAYSSGGKATDMLSKAGLPPEIAAAGGFATNLGVEAVPAVIGGGPGKAVTKAEDLGRRWMQQALVPNKVARQAGAETGDAAKAIEYLLTADANQMSKGGVQRMTAYIDELDDKLTQAIARAPDVSTMRVLAEQRKAIDSLRDGLEHATTSQAIKNEFLKFFDHPNVQGMMNLPAETAQRMKRAISKEIDWSKAPLESKSAEAVGKETGKRAVREGLSEGLSMASPEAAAINAQMSPAIKARDLVAERISAHGNKMEQGLGWHALYNPLAWIGWLADRSPYIKAELARQAYSGKPVGQAAGTAVGAASGMPPRERRE